MLMTLVWPSRARLCETVVHPETPAAAAADVSRTWRSVRTRFPGPPGPIPSRTTVACPAARVTDSRRCGGSWTGSVRATGDTPGTSVALYGW